VNLKLKHTHTQTHINLHTSKHTCTRAKPNLESPNSHAHKRYYFLNKKFYTHSIAVTFITSYIMSVLSFQSFGLKNIM